LFLSISDKLFPILGPIIDKMTDWIDANRVWLTTKIGEGVKRLAAAIENANWSAPIAAFKAIGGASLWVLNNLDLVEDALIAIAAWKAVGVVAQLGSFSAADRPYRLGDRRRTAGQSSVDGQILRTRHREPPSRMKSAAPAISTSISDTAGPIEEINR